jgi:acyl-coenzyme A thioesterase PaaI-like protein
VKITELPFNRFIGLQSAGAEPGALLSLPDAPQYLNHLGTVHASAQLALAEATSGEFLLRTLGEVEGLVPVVRRLEARFRRPASGVLSARASADEATLAAIHRELQRRGRATISVAVEVHDTAGAVCLSATVEWFLALTQPQPG